MLAAYLLVPVTLPYWLVTISRSRGPITALPAALFTGSAACAGVGAWLAFSSAAVTPALMLTAVLGTAFLMTAEATWGRADPTDPASR